MTKEQLKEAADKLAKVLHHYRMTPNQIAEHLTDFATSPEAKQYHQQQGVDLEGLSKEYYSRFGAGDFQNETDLLDVDKAWDFFAPHLKQQAIEWISVEDRLPEFEKHVMVYFIDREIEVACVSVWFDRDLETYKDQITHWQPLPPAPINSKTTEGLLRYKCDTCGNTCLVNCAPDNSICGGCDKPDWKLMEDQEPYKTTEG